MPGKQSNNTQLTMSDNERKNLPKLKNENDKLNKLNKKWKDYYKMKNINIEELFNSPKK